MTNNAEDEKNAIISEIEENLSFTNSQNSHHKHKVSRGDIFPNEIRLHTSRPHFYRTPDGIH